MQVLKSISLLLVLFLSGCGDELTNVYYDWGMDSYSAKEYSTAYKWISKAAERGHIDGQTILGVMYVFGQGVEPDRDKAEFWLLKSAEAGNKDAQSILGLTFYSGIHKEKDAANSIKWLTLAAEQGEEEAKLALEHIINQYYISDTEEKF